MSATILKSTEPCPKKVKDALKSSQCADRGNLVQCVQRKLRYGSQLPVRCQRPRPYQRPVKNPFKISGSAAITHSNAHLVNSCPDSASCTPSSTFRMPNTPRKKSLSMTDLSPLFHDPEASDSSRDTARSEGSSTLTRLEETKEIAPELLTDRAMPNGYGGVKLWINKLEDGGTGHVNNAAALVCHVLVVNAWRRRRDEVSHLRETIEQLGQQVDHLHIQIVVLRRLLETENSRVGKLSADVHRVKTQLDDASRERDALKEEKAKMESEVKKITELSNERMVAVENLRNELLSAQSQVQALDAQIARDREKLLKLREDKKILLEKVSASEALAAERASRAERAELAAEDLQLRLAAQIALLESSQEQNERLSKNLISTEEEKAKIEKRLKLSEEAGRALSLRASNLENQLCNREAALRRMEFAYNSQLAELNELKERLIRQSQESGWSSRMLQIAGSVVRAPRAILRTLSFLSSTGAPSLS